MPSARSRASPQSRSRVSPSRRRLVTSAFHQTRSGLPGREERGEKKEAHLHGGPADGARGTRLFRTARRVSWRMPARPGTRGRRPHEREDSSCMSERSMRAATVAWRRSPGCGYARSGRHRYATPMACTRRSASTGRTRRPSRRYEVLASGRVYRLPEGWGEPVSPAGAVAFGVLIYLTMFLAAWMGA